MKDTYTYKHFQFYLISKGIISVDISNECLHSGVWSRKCREF